MTEKYKAHYGALILLFLLCTLPQCNAQFSSAVQGTVADTTGAVISGAKVTLHNTATSADNTFTTSSSGTFSFQSIAPGSYTVTVEATGFDRSASDVLVETAQIRGINITLHPAGTQSRITVTAVATALNPEETRIQTTLTNDELKSLPLPNRDTTKLLQLTPGATGYVDEGNGVGYGSSIFGNGVYQPGNNNSNITTSINASGLPGESNLYLIDDLPVMSTTSRGAVTILPNPDMIDQVALQSQTFSVENGQSSSIQTAFTTKSGANTFHGAADFTYTGQFLTAKQEFVATAVAFHRQNVIGSLGGPIWKDRSFFFGSFQVLRSAGAGGGLDTWIAPEAAAWASTAFPSANGPKMLLLAPPTRVYNGVPELASSLYPYTPASGSAAASGCGTAATSYLPCNLPVLYNGETVQNNPYNGTQWNVRLDQLFRGGKDRLYGQYIHLDQNQGYLSDRGFFDGNTRSDNWYWSVNYVRVFSPKLINEAHFGAARSWSSGQQDNFAAYSSPVFPLIFSGGTIQTTFEGDISREHTYNVRDTVSWNPGAHSFRFGYQFFRGDSVTDDSALYARPYIPLFTDPLTFFQDTPLGVVGYYSIGGNGKYIPQIYGSKVSWNSIFAEDQWKVRPNLTLSLGLRYDNFGNPSKYGANAGNFYPLFLGSGSALVDRVVGVSTKLSGNAFASSQNFNFQPRAGFAWTPDRDRRMLIHGGIGLYEDSVAPSDVAVNLPTNPPNRITFTPSIFNPALKGFLDPLPYGDFKTTTAPFGINYPPVPTYGTDPFGNVYSNPQQTTVYSSGLNGYDRSLKPQKVLKYSLGTDLQGPAQMVYSIAYIGSYAYDLYYGGDWNLLPGDLIINNGTQMRRTSEWGQIEYSTNGLTSNYSGLLFAVRENYKSLFWQASYTWSHALQDAPNAGQANGSTKQLFAEVYAPKQYYGSSAFDRTNVFSLAGGYEIPHLSSHALINQTLSSWRLGTIITAQSGTPFTVVNTNSYNPPTASAPLGGGYMADGTNFGIPTYNGHHHGGWTRSQARTGVFNIVTDFSAPANFTVTPHEGNQGASTFRNPGYFTVDANVSKGFKFPWFRGEQATFLLRGEASNLLNRANLGPLGNDTNAQYFGQSSTGGYPRFLQIGGRFEF